MMQVEGEDHTTNTLTNPSSLRQVVPVWDQQLAPMSDWTFRHMMHLCAHCAESLELILSHFRHSTKPSLDFRISRKGCCPFHTMVQYDVDTQDAGLAQRSEGVEKAIVEHEIGLMGSEVPYIERHTCSGIPERRP